MKITVRQGSLLHETAPLVAMGVWKGEPLNEHIIPLIEEQDFSAQEMPMMLVYPRDALPCRRLLLFGLGAAQNANANALRQAAARVVKKAHELHLSEVVIELPTHNDITPMALAQAVAEGAELGNYRYLEYKSFLKPKENIQVDYLTLLVAQDVEAIQQGVAVGQAVARGVWLARDLANAPPNVLTPTRLAQAAQKIARRDTLHVSVIEHDELIEGGFGGILAVGQGSAQPPCLITLDYRPASHNPKADAMPVSVCLVGKGITFDTGGISLKPAEKMDEMKTDMGGAAAVLGAMQAIAELDLPLRVVGIIGAAENMPGPTAYRPGDIITTLSGKTVEVLNTDAEGRIVLADALTYAQRYHPAAILDMATLTGAVNVALGPYAIGMLSNHQALADRVKIAGDTTHERVWQLPLWDDYRDMLKSGIADMKNIGGRPAGAITAAVFLSAFVGDYPWVHLDIASTAWTDKPVMSYQASGATGVGVRLVVQLLQSFHDFPVRRHEE